MVIGLLLLNPSAPTSILANSVINSAIISDSFVLKYPLYLPGVSSCPMVLSVEINVRGELISLIPREFIAGKVKPCVDAELEVFGDIKPGNFWCDALFFTGSFDAQVKINLLDNENDVELEDEDCTDGEFIKSKRLIQLHLPAAYPVSHGDKFILRNTSDSHTIGGGTIEAEMLFGGILECASCHDVHDNQSITYMLRVDNTGSNLCLTCHAK